MKKLLLLLLLLPFLAISQVVPADASQFENIQMTNNATDNSAAKVNVQNSLGVINTIAKSDLIEVLEYSSAATLPATGLAGKIYVTIDTQKQYRWTGSIYSEYYSGKEDKTNKVSTLTGYSEILYPNEKAVHDEIDVLTHSRATGLSQGGLMTINSTASLFDFASGYGYIINGHSDPENPTVTKVTWTAKIGNSVPNIVTQKQTYVAVDINGDLFFTNSPLTATQRRNYIRIGVLIHLDNSTIGYIDNQPTVNIEVGAQVQDILNFLGFKSISGNRIFPVGANLKIKKELGTAFKQGSNFNNLVTQPHSFILDAIDPISFKYRTQTGVEGAFITDINPAIYDLNGAFTAMPATATLATIQKIYVFQDNSIRIQPGQKYFNNLNEAITAINSDIFITDTDNANNGLFLGSIVLIRGTTALNTLAQAVFVPSAGTSANGSVAAAPLGYTAEDAANKQNSLVPDGTGARYLTVDAANAGLALKANANNAALTGIPTAPTATAGTNTTQIATTTFVMASRPLNVVDTNTDQLVRGVKQFNPIATGLTTLYGGINYETRFLQVREGGNYAVRWGLQANNNITNLGTTLMLSSKPIGFKTSGGDFETAVNTDLKIHQTGRVSIHSDTDNGQDDLQVPNGTISALPATLSNQVIVKSQHDLKANIDSPTFTGTVNGISNAMVGLGNAENTSDLNKPISTATQTALNLKAPSSGSANYIQNQNAVVQTGQIRITGSGQFGSDALINDLTVGKGTGNGALNTALGFQPIFSNTIGNGIVSVGYQSGFSNIASSNFTNLGYQAGRYLANKTSAATSIANSIFLGYRASPLADSETNQIVIGYDAVGIGSNSTVLGNSSTLRTAIYGDLLVGSLVDSGVLNEKFQLTGNSKINGVSSIVAGNKGNTVNSASSVLKTINTDQGLFFGSFNGTPNFASWIQSTREAFDLQFPIALNPLGGNVLIGTSADNGSKFQANGAGTFSSSVTATSHITTGGLASQNVRGNGSLSVGYKVYTALLTQSGTSAPVATVLDNTLGGTVVWTRSSTGIYIGTLSGVFTLNKTHCTGTPSTHPSLLALDSNSVNSFSVATEDSSGVLFDSYLVKTPIEIRVYN
jgi:hypothetical protein